ncbi:ABC transporter substrate-binding protein [Haloarcula salina]|uniref:ABC transporter substrate-binding protein n=1 Tax=Haloarcula salina TaxID=1429914 RepID=A0AA41G3B2_9EURY|nr:ABC transporter substrate-binding protein [Haloarcula salina]MBV0903516.1 ABC transporter substrate-binding protein [Haloarcula salina]
MSNSAEGPDRERRSYLKAIAAASVFGTGALAGCSGDGGSGSDGGSDGSSGDGSSDGSDGGGSGSTDQSSPTYNSTALEVLHPWTGGGGQNAINAVIEGFHEEYPDIETDIRGVGATANVQLNQMVNQRLANQDPPAAFNAWPGAHLTQFMQSSRQLLGDITESVWQHDDMEGAFVDEAKELSRFDGRYVTVPIGSHRLNNLFFNLDVIESAGVTPEDVESPGDLIPLMEEVEANTDAVGMAQSMVNANTQLQLWAAIHLGMHGYQSYMDLINGEGDLQSVTESVEMTSRYAEFFNEDASTVSPPSANQKIMNGEAGFYHQGNWMAGGYNANDLTYGEDWGWIAFPGTSNMYTLHMDAFVYPNNNPAPEKAIRWHRYVGSKEAQVNFNKHKGSIPLRTDVSMEEFGPFLTETMEDFRNIEYRPPTLAHGLAVAPTTLVNLREVFSSNFMGPYEVEATAQGIIDTI